jgi:hypothetical protein
LEDHVIYPYVVLAIVVGGAALGFRRGWLREIATLGGLLLAWLCVTTFGNMVINFVNRVVLIARFTVGGGFDSPTPGGLLDVLRKAPLVDPRHAETFLGIVFVFLAIVAFVAASRFAPPSGAASGRALGALVGLANGYLVSYVGLRYLAPSARSGLDLGFFSGSLVDGLGRYLPTLLIAGVVIAIAIALVSSRRGSGRGSSRVAPGRAKG